MFKRILMVGAVAATAAAFTPAQTAEARDGYYGRGCDSCGRVVAIESVGRRDNRVGGGAVLGAIVGGALGNQVGKGDGRKAATVVGALAGGAIGHDIEKQGRRSDYYYRVAVRMDRDGRVRVYDQYDIRGLRRGVRVHVDRGEVIPLR